MNLCNGLLEIWITTSRVTARGDNAEFAFRWAFLEMFRDGSAGAIGLYLDFKREVRTRTGQSDIKVKLCESPI